MREATRVFFDIDGYFLTVDRGGGDQDYYELYELLS